MIGLVLALVACALAVGFGLGWLCRDILATRVDRGRRYVVPPFGTVPAGTIVRELEDGGWDFPPPPRSADR